MSDMKDSTQNECKYFDIEEHVTLFDLNNLKSNIKVDVIKSPLETSYQQDVTPRLNPPVTVLIL